MLSHVRQGRRGVEEMLDQAANVLAGMGATRETLKVRPRGRFVRRMKAVPS